MPVARPIADRLAAFLKPDPKTGCINFTGARPYGYGRIGWNGSIHQAHRVAWMLANGPIPAKTFVCHRCDNPSCCNVEHLFLGSGQENTTDAVEKRRHAFGERHGMAVLTREQVIKIRKDPRVQRRIAEEYGIDFRTVHAIKKRTIWAHVL